MDQRHNSGMSKKPTIDQMRQELMANGMLSKQQREANKAKFLEPSKIKDVLYRGQRRSPKADKFITTQDRATPSFTTDPEVANVYSRQLGWDIEHGPGSTSVPVHMQTEKPFDMRKHGEHASLDEFIDQMDHDLTVPTHHKKLGYEDLADILYTLDNSVFKGGAKHVINARDSKGYKIRGFDKLGDEVMSAGKKKDIDRILHELLPDASVDAYALADNPDFVKNLKKQGYDSIIHKDVFDAGMPYYQGDKDKIEEGYDANHVIDAYRPLHQNKIKSAIGNRGTYDTTNPDITKAKGGVAHMAVGGPNWSPHPENDLLRPIGSSKMVGEEKLIADDGAFKSGLSMFPSRNKSYRYVYHGEGDAPIGAMQIATQGPRSKKAVIQNLYVAEANRRQGIASKLLDRARQDFDVKHSDDLTTAGKAFAKAKKAKGGRIKGPQPLLPIETTVKLANRELPVTMDVWDKRAGRQIAHVNPQAFDKAFSKNNWQYVGPKGEGGIEGRYQRFADFAKEAPSVHASNADVSKTGAVTFGDGRHRYAYLRDQGVQKIPMSMDKQSIEHARQHGYLNEAKGGKVTHAHHLEIEERPL